MYDEFQSRVYSEKNLTSARVQDIFAEVYQKYGYQEYDGFQQEWMDQIHNFEQPMVIPGANKAAVAKGLLLDDAIDCGNPATFVKLHPDVTVVIDQEVADAIGYRA